MVAILKILDGNFEKGFKISLSTHAHEKFLDNKSLPNNQKIQVLYDNWWLIYQSLMGQSKGTITITNISADEDNLSLEKAKQELETEMKNWLTLTSTDRSWQDIREELISFFKSNHQDKRLIIQTDDPFLWKLPWSVWDILEDNKIEPTFCPLNIASPPPRSRKFLKRKVRVLLVMGDNHGLNLTKDIEIWCKFSKEIELVTLDLVQEKTKAKHKLLELLRDKKGWDIFFFTGHGKTENQTGIIHLNETETLEINQFEKTLENAIEKGLQLAYFSACESLGLAPSLAHLKIPAMIVMREKVEDEVSQKFLENFLIEYQDGHSLETAFKTAKISLESFLPGTIFIPSLWVNPHYKFPHWQELKTGLPPLSLKRELTITGFLTLLILIFRFLGLLQPLELWVFDNLVRLRPTELPDERILLVEITKEDRQQYGSPLPINTLLQGLEKINQYQPQLIGIDIFLNNINNQEEEKALTNYLNQEQSTFLVCGLPPKEIAPPKDINKEQISFATVNIDPPFNIVRRHLLQVKPESKSSCVANSSFSFKLVYNYLIAKKITAKREQNKYWRLGNVLIKPIKKHQGFYHSKVNLDSFQILLNYRSNQNSLTKAFQSVSLSKILNDQVSPEFIKGKIILIGVTDPEQKDNFFTPYGEQIRGLYLHAQMISQLLSAVEDQRPLFHFLPIWGDISLIIFLAIIGEGFIIYFRSLIPLGIFMIIWGGGSWILMITTGFILPLIPVSLTLILISSNYFLFNFKNNLINRQVQKL